MSPGSAPALLDTILFSFQCTRLLRLSLIAPNSELVDRGAARDVP
jgi:hypothetical protein